MSLVINRRDLDFLLHELLQVESLTQHSRYAQHDRATFDSVIDAAQKLAEEKFAPFAARLDLEPPTFDGTRVHMISEVKAALDAYVEGGFLSCSFANELGGLQLPYTVVQAVVSLFASANGAVAGYSLLTVGVANLLLAHGTPEQIERYAKPLIEGRWFGTMCLSEPQAGSSLGDIKTKAIPQADGSYRLVGNKMWISGGEHELRENIVHMVLARIEGAPAGTKGISLFVVPKFNVEADGSLGLRNGVRLAGINHKMGNRGTVNTVLTFGETPCIAYLVGAPNQGLACMFHMMNEARIGVGFAATMCGYAGYLFSLDYARQRPQGRPASNKNPETPQIPIIEHTDVRRMLLQQKSYVEGALALCLYCSKLVDEMALAEDPKQRADLHLLLEILTPMCKAWPSDFCLKANELAIQVLGGYGYTPDYPVERLYRDNRINPIHEGTNGIQGLDLLGRKVMMQNGAAFRLLLGRMTQTAQAALQDGELAEYGKALQAAVDTAAQTTQALAQAALAGKADLFVANASVYLDMLGHMVIAWLWLQQAQVAVQGLPQAGADDANFYRGKLAACRYFFRFELPKTGPQAALLASLDDTCLNTPSAVL